MGHDKIQWAPYPDPNLCSGGIGMEQQGNRAENIEPTPAKRRRRLFAFFIDSLILAAPLMAGGLVYFDQSVALGEWGRLLGFTVGVLYFTVFDSAWGGGRSPGKRLRGIGVIRSDGGLLSPPMAALRASILYAPIVLNGMSFGQDTPSIIAGIVCVLIFGFTLSLAYLWLFNRTRRSLHDLVAGAMVVDARTPPAPFPRSTWVVHRLVVACLCALAFAAPFAVEQYGREVAGDQDLQAISNAVGSLPPVRATEVVWTSTTPWGSTGGTVTFDGLHVLVNLRTRVTDSQALGRQIEDAIFVDHAAAVGDKQVVIVMRYGFDFGGVATAFTTFSTKTSLAEWRRKTNRKDI